MSEETLLQIFLKNCERFAKPCFRYKREGTWKSLSWKQAAEQVCAIAQGLVGLGVKKGDAVALFSTTRMEWTLCDLAILSIGAVTVPIYYSSTAEQTDYIIRDSGAKVVFVENPILQKLLPAPQSYRIILISGTAPDQKLLSFEKLIASGGDQADWRRSIDKITPNDLASIVYTSGTTGPPKGTLLTHGNFLASAKASRDLLDIPVDETALLFLPLAHILGRVMEFFQIYNGFCHAYAEGIDKLVDNFGEVHPYFFVGVPRIFEKVYERVLAQVAAGSPLKKAIFTWAVAVGSQVSRLVCQKQRRPLGLLLQNYLATALVFGKLQKRLGGKLRFAVSGGAPLAKEIAEFFHAAGILIMEGYGLTETTAVTNCNRFDNFKFGTVGPPVLGVEEKIASDGEILVRGSAVFKGYFKQPEATREVLDPDGWFHTGDIGELDPDGFLKITDRKKDIIVTAGGKNVAPQNIENMLKTVPYISQVMVLGDKRKYLSALVTLNRELIEQYAKETGIPYHDFRELTKNPQVTRLIQQVIDEKNNKLASFESIKKFAILENDLTQEAGELTPTLKVKRRFVSEKYKDILEKLYEESK